MSLSSKRLGVILNLLFAINWLFLTMVFISVQKSNLPLSGGFEIASYLIPLITLCLIIVYVWLTYVSIKNFDVKYQFKAYKYLILIVLMAVMSILTNLLILIAKNQQSAILAFGLSIGISGIFGLVTIIFDIKFFIQRLKWEALSKIEISTQNDELIIKNK
ncbi:hypothetical protein [Spiroplasma endosymbiont of Asaphidion curtum]|uniref:hypothetical protein n=1 Tax=Spiroplasma endosymbiont of Asaphidion curtum TaxID=3066281 RepID=UPI00313D3881